jgi:hypothetical protein
MNKIKLPFKTGNKEIDANFLAIVKWINSQQEETVVEPITESEE